MHTKSTTVIITRPKDRASDLIKKLNIDYHVVSIPCLEIELFGQLDLTKLQPLKFSLIIFVSVNAVEGFFKSTSININTNINEINEIDEIREHFKQNKVYAIGSATAKKLGEYGIEKVIYPQSSSEENSESFVTHLIQNEGLAALSNHSALLIRGETSREYLADHLSKLVDNWTELITYRTICPSGVITKDMIENKQQRQERIITIITSLNILQNFYKKLSKKIIDEILASQLIVISPRIAEFAKEMGFSKINCINCINDQAIIDMIRKLSKV